MEKNILPRKVKYVDFCCGTGSTSLVLESMNDKNIKFECVFAIDNEKSCCDIYKLNFPDNPIIHSDLNIIKTENIPDFDIGFAGIPCQPFSLAGNKLGMRDKRTDVFWKILNICEIRKPRLFLIENVSGLKTNNDGKSLKLIVDSFKKIGYSSKIVTLNTKIHTLIPQNRERVFLLFFREKQDRLSIDLSFKEKEETYSVGDFFQNDVDEKYYYTSKSKIYKTLENSVIEKNIVYQYRRTYVRENKSGVCPTLTANMGTGGHNIPIILDDYGIRKLTPREVFNLQGFPETYKFGNLCDSKLYKLAGNAITVDILKLLILRIKKIIIEK